MVDGYTLQLVLEKGIEEVYKTGHLVGTITLEERKK